MADVAAVVIVLALVAVGWTVFRKSAREPFVSTGLKAIDLFAPIRSGTDILIAGQPRTGMWVLTWELTYRMLRHPQFPMQVAIFIDEHREDVDSLIAEMKETISSVSNVHVTATVTPEDLRKNCPGNDSRWMAIVLSDNDQFIHQFREAVRAVRESAPAFRRLTSLTATFLPLRTGFDTVIVLTPVLAGEGIYPAIDVDHSASYGLENSGVSRKHRVVSDLARSTAAEAVVLLGHSEPGNAGSLPGTDPDRQIQAQLIRYISQPLFVAEKYTGKQGAFLSFAETTTAFDRILQGKVAHLSPQAMMYLNVLPR
ncbi:MAG: hypothetical protein R3C49_04440 [Planctomycetaceae bacterium]